MEHTPIYLVLLGMVILATLGTALVWSYRTLVDLYQDFMHFSRRFRGVE
jgi:hypothetical protein